MSQVNGRISQIIGPVIDVYFDTKGENPEKVLLKDSRSSEGETSRRT